jgi:hypothetical protein
MPSVEGIQTPLPQSAFARLATAARYAITGVAPTTWFGPQQPLAPMAPPEVKGRQFDYSDATGHVMIIGPNGTVIGTGPGVRQDGLDEGIIEHVPEPNLLGPAEARHSPKVYRRWTR